MPPKGVYSMANLTHVSQPKSEKYYILRKIVSKGLIYLILTIGAVIAILPFLWMLLTSFKTYGEHGAKVFWPAGLSASPYQDLPPTQEIVIPMYLAEDWQNVPRSFSPPLEGTIHIENVSRYVAKKLKEANFSVPFDVNILAVDDSNDDTVNYHSYILTVDSKIIEQFSTRLDGKELGGPNYVGADRGRWGPHFQVVSPDFWFLFFIMHLFD